MYGNAFSGQRKNGWDIFPLIRIHINHYAEAMTLNAKACRLEHIMVIVQTQEAWSLHTKFHTEGRKQPAYSYFNIYTFCFFIYTISFFIYTLSVFNIYVFCFKTCILLLLKIHFLFQYIFLAVNDGDAGGGGSDTAAGGIVARRGGGRRGFIV